MNKYDYSIVGGGPGGIYCALRLSELGHKVCLIESLESLGGCHRVRYANNSSSLGGTVHTEHGPRIYLGGYVNFWEWITEIGLSRDQDFSEYEFSFSHKDIRHTFLKFTTSEIINLMLAYIRHCILKIGYDETTVLTFMNEHDFSEEGLSTLNRICRLIDGGNADKTLLGPLLDGIDIGIPYKIYEPTDAMDKLVWNKFSDKLITQNVDILLNTNVIKIEKNLLFTDKGKIESDRIIITTPPYATNKISGASELLGYQKEEFNKRSNFQKYESYICATVEFSTKVTGQWGIAGEHPWQDIVIDMGSHFKNSKGSLFIVSITRPDKIDPETGKTANEMNETEFLNRIVSITMKRFKIQEEPIRKALSPNVSKVNGQWHEHDQAFLLSPGSWLKPDHKIGDKNNIFTTGHHIGNSYHTYNSMESTLQNAIHLLRRIEPKFTRSPHKPVALSQIIIVFIVILLILMYFKKQILKNVKYLLR
tara:strand:- start:333 stop:1766 length:1434 start_codon:yes stop_codon:yes gene_type:complete